MWNSVFTTSGSLKYLLLFTDNWRAMYMHWVQWTPYFDCLIQTDKDKKVRAVRFDPSKRVNLQQAYQQKSPVKIYGNKKSSSTSFSNNQDQYKILKQAKISPTSTQHNAEIGSSLLTVKQALSRSLQECWCSFQRNEQAAKQAAHTKKWKRDF